MLTAKRSCFVDGNKCADVVEYRQKFLQKMVGLGFLNQNNAPTEKAKSALTYIDSIANNLHHSQKAFWNWINKFRSLIPSIHDDDGVVSDDCACLIIFCFCVCKKNQGRLLDQ